MCIYIYIYIYVYIHIHIHIHMLGHPLVSHQDLALIRISAHDHLAEGGRRMIISLAIVSYILVYNVIS